MGEALLGHGGHGGAVGWRVVRAVRDAVRDSCAALGRTPALVFRESSFVRKPGCGRCWAKGAAKSLTSENTVRYTLSVYSSEEYFGAPYESGCGLAKNLFL